MTHLADIRHSVTVPANSTSAAFFALEQLGMNKILAEPIVSPGENDGAPSVFFGMSYCEEVAMLREMPMMEWLSKYYQQFDLPRPDSLDDILAFREIQELWLYVNDAPETADDLIRVLKKDFPNEQRIVLAAPFPLPEGLPYRCADPTGKRDFFLCRGTLSERWKYAKYWGKSVAFRGNGHSKIRVKPVL